MFLKNKTHQFRAKPIYFCSSNGNICFSSILKKGRETEEATCLLISLFHPVMKLKIKSLPHSPASTHARKKKWVNILLKQSHCNYRQSRCELLGAQTVWGDSHCLYQFCLCGFKMLIPKQYPALITLTFHH